MVTPDPADPSGALSGIRVLDVTDPIGAYVSRILGDLGADVIKIEPPEGDPGRHVAPFLRSGQNCLSLPFMRANLNKRSIVLDLNRRGDQEQFRLLAEQADIVVSTESAATWAGRGVDLEHLSVSYPGLIWTAISPFGLSGPYSSFAGNNMIAEAMGGLMYIQGDDAKPPCVSPCEQGLHLASLHAAFGTLLALWRRQANGRGQLVEVSVQEVIAHVHFILVRYAHNGDIQRRPGARNPMPPNGYYRCQDGHVFISLFMPHHWDRLAQLVNDPTIADPAFRERAYREQHPQMVDTAIQKFAERFDRWTLTETLQRVGIPAAPLSTVADLAVNAHLAERNFFVDFEQPPFGQLRSSGPLFRASASPLRIRRAAPELGAHQEEVLGTLGSGSSTRRPHPAVSLSRRAPLEGIRILDLSRVWAGPYGTRYLADFGADVIKVESSKYPDGRLPNDPVYAEINRNKRPITLNFQMPEGRELLKRLVAISDVVVENFSPRVMAKNQLDYQHLIDVRPDLIMVSMPGFGKHGPHGYFASYGGPLMAYTGMALLWGYADSPPDAHVKIAYPDYIAAGTLPLAITAALHHRARTGEGQYIEIAQVEATVAAIEGAFSDYFANGKIAAPQGNRDPNCVPQGCYPCLGHDLWCAISCTTDAQWQALAHLIGGDALAHEPRFATLADRWRHHDELDALIGAWTRPRTPHQVMRLVQAAGVPAGVVQTAEDLWRDVHLRARDYVLTLEHPEPGVLDHPGMTVRLHETPGQIRRPAELLGAENHAVFRGLLGLSANELARLVEAGVIA